MTSAFVAYIPYYSLKVLQKLILKIYFYFCQVSARVVVLLLWIQERPYSLVQLYVLPSIRKSDYFR